MFRRFAAAALLVPLTGCSASYSAPKAAVAPPPVSEAQIQGFELKAIAGSGIAYEAVEKTVQLPTFGGSYASTYTEVRFPSLTEAQFALLRKTYGNDLSRVQYADGEAYTLVDFLPPSMQALAGSYWTVETTTDGPVTSNCWSAAYEWLRQRTDDVTLYVSSPIEAVPMLKDPALFADVPAGETLRPGDLVFDSCDTGFLCDFIAPNIGHAVVVVDEGLVFEKFGIGSTLFRLKKGGGLSFPWKAVAPQPGGAYQNFYKRFIGASREQLGAPAAVFHKVKNDFRPDATTPVQHVTYALEYDAKGRTKLGPRVAP